LAICPEADSDASFLGLEHALLAHKATSDPDTLCLHEAMREPDWNDFKVDMDKEHADQMLKGDHETMLKMVLCLPEGASLLPNAWQFKHKQELCTGLVKKHKARHCLDGSKQTKGVSFWETHAPVATWTSI
jgi:hypothetical protein